MVVMPTAAKKTELGWSLEVLIPKTKIRLGELRPGRVIGFNLQIDSGSDLFYYWTAAEKIISSQHPNTWGDIQFLGSDASLEVVGVKEDETLQYIQPGRPLHVRITDPDMNLNGEEKDKVSATFRADSGDTEILILEETDTETGIFEGTLRTTLNIGEADRGRLEIFEGEQVTAEYIDQARSYGERNEPIKVNLAVTSIGTTLKK